MTDLRSDNPSLADLETKAKLVFTRNKDGSGLFELDGTTCLVSADAIADLEAHGIDFSKPISHCDGYPQHSIVQIHTHVMKPYKEAAILYWREQGVSEDDLRCMHVAHIDDNRLNCARTNLAYVPMAVNYAMKKSKAYKTPSGKWSAQFEIDGLKRNVKRCDTEEEALHGLDALKLFHLPAYEQSFIFTHSMHRPQAFVDAGHYNTKETLLARASMYKTRARAANKKKPKKARFTIIPKEDFPDSINELLAHRDAKPFDPAKHYCVRYIGGRDTIHFFLIDINHYNIFIKDFEGHFYVTAGYFYLDSDRLHVLIEGRKKGDRADDKLVVCHKIPGDLGKLDCRSSNLRTDTHSNNMRDIGKGYIELADGTFRCRTRYNKGEISMPVQTKPEAEFVTAWRRENWNQLELEFEDIKQDTTQVIEYVCQEAQKALNSNRRALAIEAIQAKIDNEFEEFQQSKRCRLY